MAGSFLVYAGTENQRRHDGMNAFLVTADDADDARTACEALTGYKTGSFATYTATQVSTGDLGTADIAFQGAYVVGAVGQTDWPVAGRAGAKLAG